MKKLVLVLFLLLGTSQFTNAQIAFGIKGGVNYNSNSIENVTNNILEGAEGRSGYHAGIWLRFKIPVIGLYLKPELVYTNLTNDVVYDNTSRTSLNIQKIDVPILLGKKILGVGNIYIGPAFQYVLSSGFNISNIQDVNSSDISMGLQFGGGIELGKIGIDVRWERGFSNIESSFIDSNLGGNVNFDTRISQIIVGLTFRL